VVHGDRCAEKGQDLPVKCASYYCVSHLRVIIYLYAFLLRTETMDEVQKHNNLNKIPDI
jgi:hypothetical protein